MRIKQRNYPHYVSLKTNYCCARIIPERPPLLAYNFLNKLIFSRIACFKNLFAKEMAVLPLIKSF